MLRTPSPINDLPPGHLEGVQDLVLPEGKLIKLSPGKKATSADNQQGSCVIHNPSTTIRRTPYRGDDIV